MLNSREQYVFEWEAQLFGFHLLMKLRRRVQDVGVELFPFATGAKAALRLSGVRINDTWASQPTVTDSIVIISEEPLAGFEDFPVGPLPADRSPDLYREWEGLNSGLVRIPAADLTGQDAWRKPVPPNLDERSDGGVDFEYLGTNNDGLKYLMTRIPYATRIEDTTIRWNDTDSLYSGEMLNKFFTAIPQSKAKFVSITGPVADAAYVHALKEAFADRPDQVECFRLHHTAPIMNFLILYYSGDREEVVFG